MPMVSELNLELALLILREKGNTIRLPQNFEAVCENFCVTA